MSASRSQVYRFATVEQWQRCLLHRFDSNKDGSLAPTVRLGMHAVAVREGVEVSTVAAEPYGAPLWRSHGGVEWQNELGAMVGPFEIDATLACSPRWIVDRHWLWAFDGKPARVRRYDRETLQSDLTIDVGDLYDATEDVAYAHPVSVVDIASDGHEGVWLLVRSNNDLDWLVHLDCEGCPRVRRRTPCETGGATQVGTVKRGKFLVLLTDQGKWLRWMDAAEGTTHRALRLGDLAPCWSASRLATDTKNRIALGGSQALQAGKPWSLFLLDGSGDMLDGPFADDVLRGEPQAALRGQNPSPISPADIAVSGGKIWFALPSGLLRLDSTEACGARESSSSLLTPALLSPASSSNRGWLRAEVSIELPKGAVLEAEYASTDEESVAERMERVASDESMTTQAKQQSIWANLDHQANQRLVITGPTKESLPIPIPLFECQDRWLWLRLTLVTPLGTVPPALKELRVLYPDISLAQYLPAVFRGDKHDPGGFLRRFVGVLESTTQRIDEKIRGIGRNIDPETAPDDWLDYLGRWLDLPWDDALPAPAKRCLLMHAGELLEMRGTRQGLDQLLRCLLGSGASVSIADLTVDYTPMRLGGRGCVGGRLPALLAGVSPRVATLGGKAVVGRAQLACKPTDCDPLQHITPTLQIALAAKRTTYSDIQPLIADILAQYVPAGVRVLIRWRARSDFMSAMQDVDGDVLDANGPGALGDDSMIGRTVLVGRTDGRIDDAGLEMGFRLK